ncbi:MAG TPA: site-specific DNA-methyltransferase, partial [Chitinophagales bacterium]|nr:site-specific DNA-methyltransferase [Chitinophagales bacterium]
RGVYMSGDLTGPKINPKDPEWHGYHPKKSGRSWAVPNVLIESIAGKEAVKTLSTFEKLELLYDNGYIIFTGNGTPRVKRYLEYSKGILLGDVWTDIKNISAQSKELIGYPTQKPEKLLERIIQMASNESDVVLDPFVGGGTTVAVADRLKRQWIGIDQSVQAVKVTELRLHNQMDLFSQPFMVKLHKYDYDTLRYKDAFEFENFIVQQFGGYTNLKQRNDSGIDGRTKENTPIQVKRSDNIGRNVVDNFYSAIQRFDKGTFEENKKEGKAVGHLIAFSFGRGATQEVARLKMAENIIINLVKIEDIVPIAKKPQVEVKADDLGKNKKGLHEIAFTATAQSDAGIEFFSWDFNYNPDTQLF